MVDSLYNLSFNAVMGELLDDNGVIDICDIDVLLPPILVDSVSEAYYEAKNPECADCGRPGTSLCLGCKYRNGYKEAIKHFHHSSVYIVHPIKLYSAPN